MDFLGMAKMQEQMKVWHEIPYNGRILVVGGYFYRGTKGDWETPGDRPEFNINEVLEDGNDITSEFDDLCELERITLEEHY